MLDEMSIRKHVQWDSKAEKYCGFVDLGTDIDDDLLPEAPEALVFMAVSVNSNWKVPCGYFLVNGLTGEEKANLTKIASGAAQRGSESCLVHMQRTIKPPVDVEVAWSCPLC